MSEGRLLPFQPDRKERKALRTAEQAFNSYFSAAEAGIEEAHQVAKAYLATTIGERSEEFTQNHLLDPDVLLSICGLLRDKGDASPATMAEEACAIHRWLARYDRGKALDERFGLIVRNEKRDPGRRRGFFGDEIDYFLGETASLAGRGYRAVGRRAEALRWLDRAEAGFRHTRNCEAGLAEIAYARLALRYEMDRYEDVLDLLPSLVRSFEQLGMPRQVAKSRLLEAMALKMLGRVPEGLKVLKPLCNSAAVREDRVLHGRFLAELGDLNQLEGQFAAATAAYQKALPLLQADGLSAALAELKTYMGAGLRAQSRLAQAFQAFRAAQRDFAALQMRTRQAYVALLTAETLLAMHRDREAEQEILAALPTIEEQKMVPEGFAAVALLRESVRRQKTDPEALRQLSEYLQAKGSGA